MDIRDGAEAPEQPNSLILTQSVAPPITLIGKNIGVHIVIRGKRTIFSLRNIAALYPLSAAPTITGQYA